MSTLIRKTRNKSLNHLDFLFSSGLYVLIPLLCSFLYSFGIISSSKFIDNFITLNFIAALGLLSIFAAAWSRKLESSEYPLIVPLICGGLSLHFGLLLAVYGLEPSDSLLWTIDSYTMHLPGSENIANTLLGYESLREMTSIWDKVYLTHLITGLSFSVFGKSVTVTALVLLAAKFLSFIFIYLLAKTVFSRRTALLAVALFSLSPTILFYTISFYKEAFVQLLVVAVTYFSYLCLIKKRSEFLIPLLVSLALITNERFYLFPIFILTYQLILLNEKKIRSIYKWLSSGFIVLCGTLFTVYYFKSFNLLKIFEKLHDFRIAFNSYSDVDPSVNLNISYPASLIKLTFTPFFTFNKFDMFFDYSYLLIWGAPLNQIVIAFSVCGILYSLYKNPKNHLIMTVPFFCFIALYAYIAPYNGRLRDSFFPILVIYAAQAIHQALDKLKAHKA